MERRFMMKKILSALIVTAFLSMNLAVAEAAPPKKGAPYPYQQSQQNNRSSTHQAKPNSPRPPMHQPRPSQPRPAVHQARPSQPRPVVHQARQSQPRPTVQQARSSQPRPSVQQARSSQPRPTVQQARTSQPRPTVQQARSNSPRPSVQQTRTNSPRPSVQQARPNQPRPTVQQARMSQPRPMVQQARSSQPRPTVHQTRSNSPRPSIQQTKSGATRQTIQKPKPVSPRPKVQEPKKNVAKPDIQNQKYREHTKKGPRKDLHRPPIQRTYGNMHVWRRAPKAPRDYWWNHRPAHRRGRYRGYYNGIYYSDVLSTLLVAEVIHSSYYTGDTAVINYADLPDQSFIPEEAIKYKGHHYLVFSDIGNSMEDAQQFCESIGGHLATVGDDAKNERLYRLINNSGYDNEYFEKSGSGRMIPDEPVTYVKTDPGSNSEGDETYYGMYYWNYRNLREDGTSDGTGGNAFVCEWDR